MPARSESLPHDDLNPSAVHGQPIVLVRITGPRRSVRSSSAFNIRANTVQAKSAVRGPRSRQGASEIGKKKSLYPRSICENKRTSQIADFGALQGQLQLLNGRFRVCVHL